MTRLARVRIAGRLYFQDDRLEQFRAVHNPYDILSYSLINPTSELLQREPPIGEDEGPEVAAKRAAVDDMAWAIQSFGISLWQTFGICPEFENDGDAEPRPEYAAIHKRFWTLQNAYAEAVADLWASLDRRSERYLEPASYRQRQVIAS